ncbi:MULTISPECIES: 4Fe-4S binding protein [unclassified Treponema]|uniref:4Fe-4S binding protein n=1 Tax=unclassified Treponema TaxID=2638727 RepID=UPI0020A23694|nr:MULTISPECIES: 4Fe-4S binding protein [unclassified Treponema]UTC67452.1 4Fe-4S binding protein [Treponema sp. OMZ 789]UTC70180.1 4Fe-4S binding protein [Treponema sp. OMZ 790]UTC72895.1 4Fe-4S binding protein [Treponema sp. OMZ 791]
MANQKKQKTLNKKRHAIQALGMLAVNGNLIGFLKGQIYKGPMKKVCMPVLNCYSCPGALFGCPIGSIQATIGSNKFSFAFYVVGLLSLFAIAAGRFFCGYICPFGFFQDLLDKIPLKKIKVPQKINKILKYLKYFILAFFVFVLPFAMQDKFGLSDPYFCKYICPSGILFGAIPLISVNQALTSSLGALFGLKFTILAIITMLSMIFYRPFCRYLCPLGAFLGIFNPISLYRLKINDKCIKCKKCEKTCKLDIPTYTTPNSPECIRCGECIKACPVKAIEHSFLFTEKTANTALNAK